MLKRLMVYALTLVLTLGSVSGLGLTASAYAAQGATGRLGGTVANPQGEVIAGASVTVTDNSTGKTATTTSGGEGNYSFPQLEASVYTVKVATLPRPAARRASWCTRAARRDRRSGRSASGAAGRRACPAALDHVLEGLHRRLRRSLWSATLRRRRCAPACRTAPG